MNKKLFFFFFLPLLSSTFSFAKHIVIYDGIFDLTHYGHQGAIKKARATAAKSLNVNESEVYLIVGVTDVPENDLKAYKRSSIFTIAEKKLTLQGFKGVDEVISTPMVMDQKFLEKLGEERGQNIELVLAGADYENSTSRDKYYSVAWNMGIFRTFPRTVGVSNYSISTTDLIGRILNHVLDTIQEKLESKPDDNTVENLKALEQVRVLFKTVYKKN